LIGQFLNIPSLSEKTMVNSSLASFMHLSFFDLALPLGVSYYSFQFISFASDLSKDKFSEKPSLSELFVYIFFFPVVTAGPITRFLETRNQFKNPEIDEVKMYDGIYLVLSGLIRKMFFADTLASVIYPVFQTPEEYSGQALYLTSLAFAAHLYFDFSGLTDLARGLGKLLGIELPMNFRAPFFLNSFSDFWRRWHLSFSYWIRDYIYIPLGGSRVAEWKVIRNLIITFALGGLWHGANLNFLLWGTLTGVFLSLERFFENKQIEIFPKRIIFQAIKYILVLNVYLISWVLFFTKDVGSALTVIYRIISFQNGKSLGALETIFFGLFAVVVFHILEEKPEILEKINSRIKKISIIPVSILVILGVFAFGSNNLDFFYARF
jgi:D-alanyl-lipoteichoic acid acyltransferase DltB (MBOAT superfamily)